MKNNILLATLIAFALVGCVNSKQTQQSHLALPHQVEIAPENNTLKLSTLFKDYRIIPLQGEPLNCVIDVAVADSMLVIGGKTENSSVHLYTMDGKYKNHMITTGRGPQEAYNIQSFKLTDSVTVEILCNFAERLFTYSLQENKIVKQRNLPKEIIGSEDFIRLDTAQYAFFKPRKAFLSNKNDEYKINILNLNTNKIERQFIPITPNDEYICFSQTRRFHKRDGKCLYYDVFSPGIYQICPDSLSLYIAFEEGKYGFPRALLEKEYRSFDEFAAVCEQCPYIWGHIDMAESSKYIFSTYRYKNSFYLNVIDKTTMTSKSYTHIYDDLITDATFNMSEDVLWSISAISNAQIFSIEPFQLKEIIAQKKKDGTFEAYQKKHPQPCVLADSLANDDNSLIILFYE